MPKEPSKSTIEDLLGLVAEAELSIGFISGTGLGAVLLTVIVITFILSRPFASASLSRLVAAWRGRKLNATD